MTNSSSYIKLEKMRLVAFLIIASILFGFQQKPMALVTANLAESVHSHHEDMNASAMEAIEALLTGTFTHTHEHEESAEADPHEHSHAHHFDGSFGSPLCVLVQVQFFLKSHDLSWRSVEAYLSLKSYYAEILRPPIFS